MKEKNECQNDDKNLKAIFKLNKVRLGSLAHVIFVCCFILFCFCFCQTNPDKCHVQKVQILKAKETVEWVT